MNKYIRIRGVMTRYDIGHSTVYDWVGKKILPLPLLMGKTPVFDVKELDDMDEARKNAREKGAS